MEQEKSPEIKSCCATFYESDIVRLLMGDVLHPGGLELTEYLGNKMSLSPEDRILDIACGRGSSAVYLVKKYGCRMTGVDYSEGNIASAREHAATQGVSNLTFFHQSDAERLPFEDSSFDAVITECSYCTFPDKTKAASEMFRVLRSGGRVGITDMVINGTLPEEMQSVLSWVTCIGGAGSANEYVSQLQKPGFTGFMVEDKREVLLEMIDDIRRKFLALDLATGIWKMDMAGIDLTKAKDLMQNAVALIEKGVVGYVLITAKKQ
ncbi:class I SAM-dependent methyltransferase [Chloroflexota bacterium]